MLSVGAIGVRNGKRRQNTQSRGKGFREAGAKDRQGQKLSGSKSAKFTHKALCTIIRCSNGQFLKVAAI